MIPPDVRTEILRRNVTFGRERTQERLRLRLAEVARMPLSVGKDEPTIPSTQACSVRKR